MDKIGEKNKNEEKEKTKKNMKNDGNTPDSENGGANVFARSGILQRSPVSNLGVTASSSSSSKFQEEQPGVGLSQIFTPISSSSKSQELQLGRTKMTEVRRKIDDLYVFVKDKNNVHKEIKQLVTGIKSGITVADRECQEWRKRAENAEKALLEAKESIRLAQAHETPKGPTNPRPEKRDRDTPGDEEEPKKRRDDEEGIKEMGENGAWRKVENQKERKKKQKEDEVRKKEEEARRKEEEARKKEEKKKEDRKNKEKPRPRRERSKGDALVVEAKDKTSYAALLRKVREDPELKQLGENVVKTRRTQKGEMLFELKKDSSVRSSAFKERVEKSLGEDANVRALSQESVVECKDLDEITTEDEVRCALKVQGNLGDVPMTIRLRKAYGGTQTASIRLATDAANELLKTGRVKVGWSVCPLKAIPRVTKQMER